MDNETFKALQELIRQASDKKIITDAQGVEYAIDDDGDVCKLDERLVNNPLCLSQLTSLVDWLMSEASKLPEGLIINITSPTNIGVFGPLDKQGRRPQYVDVQAIVPHIPFGSFMDQEDMVINLQANFEDSKDRDVVMQVVSNLKDEEVHQQTDDGVTQTVTINSGVATVSDVKVPNPVELTPYRTFQEVAQPTSRFIFRMRQGGQSALFEADNSQWQVAAKQEIKVYLEQAQKQAWDEIKYPVLA